MIPFVIDNQEHRLADVLNALLAQTAGKPLDVATAYFAVSGYRLVKDRLHQGSGIQVPLPAQTFVAQSTKLLPGKRPSAAAVAALAEFQCLPRARQVELLARQRALEKSLAELVEDAYGLTPDERALLRATRPVRDPLDVLESRIRNRTAEGADAGDACSSGGD